MPTYEFKVTLRGTGTSEGDAWDNAVEGFIQEPGDFDSAELVDKPKVQLSGQDGNVFAIISACIRALRRAKMLDKAEEFREKTRQARSYDEVLVLAMQYCDVD